MRGTLTTPQLTLTSGTARLVVDPARGGRLAAWHVDGHDLLVGPDPTRDPEGWGCYPMVPWAGRVRDATLRWQGRTVRLPHPSGPHALHGVGHRLPWDVQEAEADRLTLTLAQALALPRTEAGAGWPFGGTAEQTVVLHPDAVELTLRTTAGAVAMPLTVGWHPWFPRWVGGAQAAVSIGAGRMLQRGQDGLPTGRWVLPTDGPWDDCFTDLSDTPTVTWPGVGAVTVDSDLDHVVVFDQHPSGVCVEPQSGPPDEVNGPDPRVLSPGATHACRMTLRWVAG